MKNENSVFFFIKVIEVFSDDCKTQLSDIATEISDTDPKSMSITRLLKQASKSTSDANDKIRAITPEISAVFDLKANKLGKVKNNLSTLHI